jgi:hypothetical protein
MSEIRNEQAEKAESKKSYSRPELLKHGAVETLTQGRGSWTGGCSGRPVILQNF